jgi:hypothetical protein
MSVSRIFAGVVKSSIPTVSDLGVLICLAYLIESIDDDLGA